MLWLASAACDDSDLPAVVREDTNESLQQLAVAATERLEALESYRYTTTLEVTIPEATDELGAASAATTVTGEAIPPDHWRQVATSSVGAISAEEELISLPDGNFIRRGDSYTEGQGELNTSLLSVPSLWSTVEAFSVLLPDDPERENATVGDDLAVHYTVDNIRLLQAKDFTLRLFGAVESADDLPDRYRVELWFSSEGGILLQLLISGERIDGQGRPNTFRLESTISDIGEDFEIELD
ncbi:MAG: hypothetical protein WEB00_02060 [Dehalococcoidia bacterium]